MNGVVLLSFLALLGFSVGETALQCYYCDYLCVSRTAVSCRVGEVCANITAHSDGVITIAKKGCLAEDRCNKEEDETFAGSRYKVRNTCCSTNLCNGAQLFTLSGGVGVVAVMSFILMRQV
ncbi:prostate stem cell antigen-like [Lissotriton helveticus]